MIKDAITPLRLIFWGGLLCVFDFNFSQTVNGSGFKFDILNDALGYLLITIGVFQLAPIPVHQNYTTTMTFVKVMAVLALLDAIRSHFIVPLPAFVGLLLQVFGLVSLVAMVLFCVAMQWLSSAFRLTKSAASWATTMVLFVAIYLVPLGLIYLLGLATAITRRPFNFNLGPAGLLILPLFAIPLIHLFVSTSRIQREAEAYEGK